MRAIAEDEVSAASLISDLKANNNDDTVVDILRRVCNKLNTEEQSIVPYAQELVRALTALLQRCCSSSPDKFPQRMCKYALNTLMQLFSRKTIAMAVNSDAQAVLVHELLTRLLDPKLTDLPDGQTVLRGLNTLMHKLLENSDPNVSFGTLFTVMSDCLNTKSDDESEGVALLASYLSIHESLHMFFFFLYPGSLSETRPLNC